LGEIRKIIHQNLLSNVIIKEGLINRIENDYTKANFTIIPYTRSDGGKECPRSLIESLSCGTPVMISEMATFADFVADNKCGIVFPMTVDGFVSAIQQGTATYKALKASARTCAETFFDIKKTFSSYKAIYHTIRG
jgi:glycosyltransferase involved in cell wall biosynthesis